MYLIDFFKRTFRKSNIAVIIYLILNVIIISLVFSGFFAAPLAAAVGETAAIPLSILCGMAIYIASLALALSPVGEWYVRFSTGCHEIKDQQVIDYLVPIFNEVYAAARKKDPSISDEVKLFMNDDPCPNAFATGRKTVCITKGLMSMPKDQIRATLGHEFGHLAHKDTDLLLAVNVGNLIVNGIILFIKVGIEIFHIMMVFVSLFIGGDEGWLSLLVSHLYSIALAVTVAALSRLWSWIGTMLCMKSSRGNEFEADAFSTELGYGRALIDLLNVIGNAKPQGLFATLAASHPPKDQRIDNIKNVMSQLKSGQAVTASPHPAIPQQPGNVITMPKPANTDKDRPAGRPRIRTGQPAGHGTDAGSGQYIPAGAAAFQGGSSIRRPGNRTAGQVVRPKFCTECGEPVTGNANFCTNCGYKFL